MEDKQELKDDFLQQLSYYKHYQCFQHENQQIEYQQIHTQKQLREQQVEDIKQCNLLEHQIQQKINTLKDDLQKLEDEKEVVEKQKRSYQMNAQLLLNAKSQEQFQITKEILDIKAYNPPKLQQKNSNSITKKRRVFSQQEKMKVVEGLKIYGLKHLSQISNIHQNQILKWSQSENKALPKTGRPITSLELEQVLVEYIKTMRRLKKKISKRHVKEKAEREANNLNVDIKASIEFINGFLKRNNFTIRKINSQQKVIISEDIIKNFTLQIIAKLDTDDYDLNQVINFDDSGVYKDDTGSFTIAEKGERHVIVKTGGETKKCYSIGLAINFTGTKLNQAIVWPTKGIRDVFKKDIPKNTEIIYRDNISYFNLDIFKEWINLILKPHAQLMMDNKKGILIIENFKGHSFEGIQDLLKEFRYELIYLPSNTTHKLQPLDYNINRIYKRKYQQKQMDHQLFLSEDEVTKITHGQFLTYISEVWDEVTTENVLQAWTQYHQKIEEKKETNKDGNKMISEQEEQIDEEDLYIFNHDSLTEEDENIQSNQIHEVIITKEN